MKKNLTQVITNSKNYTMAVAEAMPEKHFGSKMTPHTWSFGELLVHIAYGIEWWCDNHIKNTPTDWVPPSGSFNKKSTVEYLSKVYKELEKIIQESEVSDQLIVGTFATIDHITHHRGQLVLQLRSHDIEPPEYTF